MRVLFATLLAASLFATGTFAATDNAGLAPGKPSGVKEAQEMSLPTYLLLGLGAVAAIAVIGSASSGGKAIVNPTGTP